MHPFRSTAFLLLLAAFLAAFVALFDRDAPSASRSDSARRAFRFDPSRVRSVSFSWPSSGESALCRRDARSWSIAAPVRARADSDRIDEFLDALAEIPAGDLSLLPRPDDSPDDPYGFSPPRVAISLAFESSSISLLVGRSSPIGNGVFVRRPDRDAILRIPASALARLPRNLNDLRSPDLLLADPAAVCHIEIQRPGAAFLQLDRRSASDPWCLQARSLRADAAAVSDFLQPLLACSVTRFVADNADDLSAYALDPQSATVVSIATAGDNAPQSIAFGAPLPDNPDLVFARLLSESSVYAVPAAPARAIPARPEDFLDSRLAALASPSLLTRFRASSPSESLEFAFRTDEAAWSMLRPFRGDADSAAVSGLFRSLSGIRVESFDPFPIPSAPPALSLSVSLATEPDPYRLDFYPDPQNPGALSRLVFVDPLVSTNPATARLAPPGLPPFPLDPALYASRSVVSIPEDHITVLELSSPSRHLKVAADPLSGDWSAYPDIRPVLDELADLRTIEWLPDDALPESIPCATLRVNLSGLRSSSRFFTIASNGVVAFRGHPRAFRLPHDSPILRWAFPDGAPTASVPATPAPDANP